MQTAEIIEIHDQVQGHIVELAFQRFRHYGYTKTTMSDIADDAGMSAANLYRYFRNKQEIAAFCVMRCISDRLEYIQSRINRKDLTATEQLRELTMATLRYCYEIYSKDVRINDLIGFIADERPDIAEYKMRLVQTEIQTIMENGNHSGEFNIDDTEAAARAFYFAIALFDTPVFIGFYSIQRYEVLANEVIDLLLAGLKK